MYTLEGRVYKSSSCNVGGGAGPVDQRGGVQHCEGSGVRGRRTGCRRHLPDSVVSKRQGQSGRAAGVSKAGPSVRWQRPRLRHLRGMARLSIMSVGCHTLTFRTTEIKLTQNWNETDLKLFFFQPKRYAPALKRFSCFSESESLSAVCAPNHRRGWGDDVCVTLS